MSLYNSHYPWCLFPLAPTCKPSARLDYLQNALGMDRFLWIDSSAFTLLL